MTDLLHLLAWAWRAVPAGPDLLLIALGLLLVAVLLPMIDRPAVDPGDDDPVLPPKRRK